MALQLNKDKYGTNEFNMSSLVALCSNCASLCLERTERAMENMSRAPRGWEAEYTAVARERQREDLTLCQSHCARVASVCPAPEALERFEAVGHRTAVEKPVADGLPTLQQVSRCEHALMDFTQVLFSLAHKPSKIVFEKLNPKTGERLDDEVSGGAAAGSEKSVLSGRSFDETILNRWSSSKREHEEMEKLGIVRSPADAASLKRKLERQGEEQSTEKKGTTPRW
ncbi:unnamed protein product [Trypanosoma congolense IL3000]|uniref:WGS project CAEQ00000000 data, annotated contig 1171 n=1 Tax=Trypanosoma congolense (strain IL3000) TaxID=1068625 RepID=F9WD63_TRYCI|nr:unnamed protein product [Trypanosoma congolense IL3000]CCD15214.1 unnamed protein product [Trypanosoma congolense IL3000]